jgi:serine/threonine protein kinase
MPVHGAGPETGTLLQRRYRVAARIASGGMGTVYRAWDERLDRAVAVKLLHPHLAEDAEVRNRFRAEARHAARVRHPNVVAVLDQDEHDGTPFIVMELVDGPSLCDLLNRRTRLAPAELLAFLVEICAGLGAVHDVGLVHRDVKPENLLHDVSGHVRVADFGIARALDSTMLTPVGTMLGSVQYMAPEVVLGQAATWRSDQYSLGIVAFEALTGRTPLPAEVPMAAALRHAREQVPPPSSARPEVTPAIDRVVMTATAKEPAARYPSLDALLDALRVAVDGTDGGAGGRPRTDILPAPSPTTRRPVSDPAPPAGDDASGRRRRARRRSRGSDVPQPARAPSAPVPAPRAAVLAQPLATQRPVYVRARMSALAIVALAFTLVQIGAFVAPVLGLVALRRIDRSHGALRGEAVAGLAILLGLARLGGRVLAEL